MMITPDQSICGKEVSAYGGWQVRRQDAGLREIHWKCTLVDSTSHEHGFHVLEICPSLF